MTLERRLEGLVSREEFENGGFTMQAGGSELSCGRSVARCEKTGAARGDPHLRQPPHLSEKEGA